MSLASLWANEGFKLVSADALPDGPTIRITVTVFTTIREVTLLRPFTCCKGGATVLKVGVQVREGSERKNFDLLLTWQVREIE